MEDRCERSEIGDTAVPLGANSLLYLFFDNLILRRLEGVSAAGAFCRNPGLPWIEPFCGACRRPRRAVGAKAEAEAGVRAGEILPAPARHGSAAEGSAAIGAVSLRWP